MSTPSNSGNDTSATTPDKGTPSSGEPFAAQAGEPPTPGMPPYPPYPYPAPPYGYPAYPQGSVPYPYGYAPAPPPRENNTTLWVVLSIVGVVLIGACVACAVAVANLSRAATSLIQQYEGPLITSETFCSDETSHDYAGAYGQFSPTLRASITLDAFVTQSQVRDNLEGAIQSCDVNTSNLQANSFTSSTATLTINMTRSGAGTFTGSVTLVKDGGTWTIDSVDPSLPVFTDGTSGA